MSSENEFEFDFEIDEKDMASARFMTEVHRALTTDMARATRERKLTRSDVARLLGTDRSAISRLLNGKSNITIRTLAELCWAIGVEPSFQTCRSLEEKGCNEWVRPKKTTSVQDVATSGRHLYVTFSGEGKTEESSYDSNHLRSSHRMPMPRAAARAVHFEG